MDGYTPLDALNEGIKEAHIRKGAAVSIGGAQWADGEYAAALPRISISQSVTQTVVALGSW